MVSNRAFANLRRAKIPATQRSVVIFGYYGRGNWGDEVNLRKLIAFLQKIYPQIMITVISAEPGLTATKYGVNAVGRFNLPVIIKTLKQAQVLIAGGGCLFQDQTSLRSLLYYSGIVCLGKLLQLKVYLHGQGVGPLRSRPGRVLAGWALNQAALLTVRDRLSIVVLAELNVTRPIIHLTAEPLLEIPKLPSTVVKDYWLKHHTTKELRVGLALRRIDFIKPLFWESLINFLSWDASLEIYLIPLADEDREFLERIATKLGLAVLTTDREWEELLWVVGGLDLLVSSRLHALVAATTQLVPTYGLAIDSRLEAFCRQLELPYTLLTAETQWLPLAERIKERLEDLKTVTGYAPTQLKFWHSQAVENWRVLGNFLQELRP